MAKNDAANDDFFDFFITHRSTKHCWELLAKSGQVQFQQFFKTALLKIFGVHHAAFSFDFTASLICPIQIKRSFLHWANDRFSATKVLPSTLKIIRCLRP